MNTKQKYIHTKTIDQMNGMNVCLEPKAFRVMYSVMLEQRCCPVPLPRARSSYSHITHSCFPTSHLMAKVNPR